MLDTGGLGTADDANAADGNATQGDGDDAGRLDVANPDFPRGPGQASCEVAPGEGDGVVECLDKAMPNSFEPVVEWSYGADYWESVITPLVANLSDDNGDDVIDLCDTPDVVLVAGGPGTASARTNGVARIHLLDGATGEPHTLFAEPVSSTVTPAIGDIDGDGRADIVTIAPARTDDDGAAQADLIAFEGDGSVKWQVAVTWDWMPGKEPPNALATGIQYGAAIALADLTGDGNVEILAANRIFGAGGGTLASFPVVPFFASAPVAVDLDDDGDLEVVIGHCAFHHNGQVHWCEGVPTADATDADGYAAVADLDNDGRPEVLVTDRNGITLHEHDGQVVYSQLRPTGDESGFLAWQRPAAVHDFDGDGDSEYATASSNRYAAYDRDGSITWEAEVLDMSGLASGTAFDFLGDGTAEAMYADESNMFVFDEQGKVVFSTPRTSYTFIDYPIVVDVDNDASAEVLYVSDPGRGTGARSPTLQVIGDIDDRWVAARRIWNQHTYHVTNVREDGTIPAREAPHWKALNTFRTQAQLTDEGVCRPRPPAQG